MKLRPLARRLTTAFFLGATPAAAQHCGGPCEVPRPAGPPVSSNARFGLVPGPETENWRYLDNYIWTQDGQQRHRLEEALSSPPLVGFGLRRFFVSPAGNGFLVTGNAYVETHSRFSNLDMEASLLFVFSSPEGEPLVSVSIEDGLTPEERMPGPCPADCGCDDVLYTFEKDPALSASGCFVELTAAKTRRVVSFFLPLGAPIDDRAAFENRLAELEWARLPAESRKARRVELEAFVAALEDADAGVRAEAEKAIVQAGFLALPILRKRQGQADSAAWKLRVRPIEERLRPWADVGFEKMSIDLELLTELLTYPEEPVVRAVQARLAQILPEAAASDPAKWVAEHRDHLRWDAQLGRYTKGD